jgi:glucokinase
MEIRGRMILSGDIGGTKTRFAAFDDDKSTLIPECEQVFQSSQHKTLEEIVRLFIESHKLEVSAACIGFAGAVKKGKAVATNLPWVISTSGLTDCLGVSNVWIINDLEANAYGIEVLSAEDFQVINEGEPDEQGNAGLISAGTGLGEAGLVFDGKRLRPFASEGGHADFAPKDDVQVELLRYLETRFGHVSWERVVSGMGLFNIYSFLRDTGRGADPDWLVSEILQGDSAACISHTALQGKSELCNMALNMFVSFYGAEAGNLALKLMATGGIYLGGGIAPKIIERLKAPLFFQSFSSKGRFERVLRDIPVRVILNDKAALLGAARYAYLRMESSDRLKSVGRNI